MESGTEVRREGWRLTALLRQIPPALTTAQRPARAPAGEAPRELDPARIDAREGAYATIVWDSRRRRALALADMVGIAIAYFVSALTVNPAHVFDLERLPLLALLPGWVLLNKLLGLYDRDANLIHKSSLNELPGVVQSVSVGVALIFIFGPPLIGFEPTRLGAILFWVIAGALIPVLRYSARAVVRRTVPAERCLIVGAGPVSELLARKIQSHPQYGAEVVALVDLHDDALEAEGDEGDEDDENEVDGAVAVDVPVGEWVPTEVPRLTLSGFDEFERVARRLRADRVLIGFSRLSVSSLLEIIQISKLLELKVSIVPRLFEMIGHSVDVDQVEGMTLLGVRGFTRTRSSLALKRMLDVLGAGIGLVLLSPLLIAIAIAVKLGSSGPVFFRQRRIGRRNEPFTLLKFRTMVEGADEMKDSLQHLNEADGIMFKIAEDPRVTRLGRLLRRTSLDELPQLWNVLRGEMSLVGPRPLVPDEDGHVIGWHRARLDLTPGLTGPWQVMGRTLIPFQEMIKLDYLYVAEWSLWGDIKLLLRTAPVVVLGKGA